MTSLPSRGDWPRPIVERAELTRRESELRLVLGRLDADLLAAETAAGADRHREQPFDLVEAASRAEGSKARAAGLVALLEERRRSLERILTTTVDRDVIAALEAEGAALVERLRDADQEAAGLLPAADELTEAEQQLASEAEEAAERWRADPSGRAGAAAEVRGELAARRASLERSGGETQRLASRGDAIDRRIDRLTGERARLDQILSETDQAASGVDAAEQVARRALTDADAALDAAVAFQRRAETEQHRWAARRDALSQALDAARARAGAARLADLGGVIGTLLELVEVDDGFEGAFEAAAGPALAAVLVDGVGAARRGLEEFQRDGVAGAVLAVPEAGVGRTFAAPDPAHHPNPLGGALPLRPMVRSRVGGVADLLDRVLAGAVVVDGGWEEAVDLAVGRPDLVVVTRSGDRCAGGIWQIGAGGGGVTGAALEEAGRQAGSAAEEAAAADTALQATRRAAAAARTHHDDAARAVQVNTSRRQAAADNGQRVAAELAEAISERAAATAQQHELASRLERERARLSELQSLLPGLEAEAEAEAARAVAERAARSRLAERTAALAAMRRDLEVRAAGLEERRAMSRRRLAEVDDRLCRHVADRDEAAARRQELGLAMTVTGHLAALVAARQAELDEILNRLRTARRAQADAVQARAERLEQLRHQRSGAERQLGEARQRINRAELDETEGRLRLETIVEAIRRDLECEPEAVRGSACPPLPPGTSASSRRAELERELRLMGPVNPLALDEHTALLERHQFLDEQLEDVRNARRELSKVIRAVDAEIVEVFRAAYADVADNFESLFATLFPGGVGRLRLTEPDHLLETGIEVEARPSGKNVRRLSLLSGGERSLTAMAFLFAVFRSRPSPFYLMDEVEAALDDVNLHRFLDLLHEFHAEAQLLVVSHQKRTMEAADCLYGVTMASAGSSRVISEKVTVATPR